MEAFTRTLMGRGWCGETLNVFWEVLDTHRLQNLTGQSCNISCLGLSHLDMLY